MKTKLLRIWDSLRSSYWFVPALMVVGAAVAAEGALALDRSGLGGWLTASDWLASASAANSRALLTTVAGSMITVAGVTFSVVMVALSIASSQFGPRLLVNFMRDRGNQVVLGTFVATFVYSVLVLRRVGDPGDAAGSPHTAVVGAVVLAVASLGVLIYFFHHVATSIQAGQVVAQAGDQLESAIRTRFPQQDRAAADGPADDESPDLPADFESTSRGVEASSTGYLSDLDVDALAALAEKHDLVLRVEVGEGQFVVDDSPLLRVSPGGGLDDEVEGALRDAFHVVRRRATARDVQLAVDRLAEIAVRALSPGTNDPYTALACLDRLGAALALLAERGVPARARHGEDGRLRVLLRPPTVPELLDAAFEQIRFYGGGNPRLVRGLLEAISLVAARSRDPLFLRALSRHAALVARAARREIAEELELAAIDEQLAAARRLLER